MKLSNVVYDVLKTLGTIILPAIAVFYNELADIWGLPYSEQIPQTIMALVVLLNSWLGIKSASYYKDLSDTAQETGSVDDGFEHTEG